MKTVIVYYSMSENTAFAAEKIAARLGADLVRLTPVKAIPDKGFRKFLWGGKSALMGEKPKLAPYDFHADGYDAVILGTPVWASSPAPPLRSFLAEHGDALRGKRLGAFVCSMGGGPDRALQKLAGLLPGQSFAATLSLIEPKEKPKEEVEEQIALFCKAFA